MGPAAAPHKGHVELLSDAVEVKAGEPEVVELRFRVEDGFHINSHTPKDELLIATALQLSPARGMKVVDEQYPHGSTFRLPLDSGGTLDVYQGEFRVSVRLVAPKGSSTLTGLLKYQACDNAVCYPPKTLPVMVAVTGH
ncbi:MAG TPA: protein-disulfide reductase DsbD N-terminal domain-containing protein [Acidobacteriaceae bacterium]|nr:protein-disulfide reductase DsbD N-terminal domain-containing protein [Acidobacteriaceae bacterium]